MVPANPDRRHHRRALLALLLAAAGVVSGCAAGGPVTRVVHGRQIRGRFVSDRAYSSYLRGVVLESEGKLPSAEVAFAESAQEDGASVEAWVRVGAVRCALWAQGADHGRAVWLAFARAERIDSSYEELWTERARCHLAQHSPPQALAAARRAIALDPDAVDAAIVLASALERTGAPWDALRWLDGLVVREPRSREAQHAMLDYATRHGDDARAQSAHVALRELGASSLGDGAHARRAIDEALVRGHDQQARSLARAAHIANAEIALRAAALGRLAAARSESGSVLSADPSDGDARVAAMIAADLSGDWEGLRQYAAQLPDTTTALSPLARALLDQLIVRRAGTDPSRGTVPAATGGTEVSDDPLLDALRARLSGSGYAH